MISIEKYRRGTENLGKEHWRIKGKQCNSIRKSIEKSQESNKHTQRHLVEAKENIDQAQEKHRPKHKESIEQASKIMGNASDAQRKTMENDWEEQNKKTGKAMKRFWKALETHRRRIATKASDRHGKRQAKHEQRHCKSIEKRQETHRISTGNHGILIRKQVLKNTWKAMNKHRIIIESKRNAPKTKTSEKQWNSRGNTFETWDNFRINIRQASKKTRKASRKYRESMERA